MGPLTGGRRGFTFAVAGRVDKLLGRRARAANFCAGGAAAGRPFGCRRMPYSC